MPQAIPMIVMAAMAAASTAMTISAQNKQADATEQAAQNAAAADYVQQSTQQDQINQQAAVEKSQRSKQAMMERASLRVAQGESGLSGISSDREAGAVENNNSYDQSIMGANTDSKIRQVQAEKGKTYADAQGRINMADSKRSSNWSAGLQIGMAGTQGAMSGYTTGKALKL